MHSIYSQLWITANLREDDYRQAPVVQKVDSAINQVNLHPLDGAISFPNTYPLDEDLSDG